MIQFKSFEETLVLLGAAVMAAVAYKLFKASALTSVLMAAIAAAAIAYVTFFEFTLREGVITYRNRFREMHFPLSYVRNVSMRTFWAGLPGHTFMFLMRSPPADIGGYFVRTGLISWPSASRWVDAVNGAIRMEAAARHDLFSTYRLLRATRTIADSSEDEIIPMQRGLLTYMSDGRLFLHIATGEINNPPSLTDFDTMTPYVGTYKFDGDWVRHDIDIPSAAQWSILKRVSYFRRAHDRIMLSTRTSVTLELEKIPDFVMLSVEE